MSSRSTGQTTCQIGKLWSRLSERRVNLFAVVTYLAHQVSYSCSPLVEELVELDRKQERKNLRCGRGDAFFLDELESESDVSDENLWYYLLQPSELIRLIKRYHKVGNVFFALAFTQFASLLYISFKAVFQATFIGHDESLARQYAKSWFPRILESFPNPENMYSLFILLCSYYITLRLLCIRRLVKNSVINRNGYKLLSMTMTNFPVAGVYYWPIKTWVAMLVEAYNHKRLCDRDNRHRKAHLSLEIKSKDRMLRFSKKELIYYRNVVDFSACFGEDVIDEMQLHLRSSWAKGWHIAQPTARIDPHELGLLVALQMAGLTLLFSLVALLIFLSTFYEISRLTPDPDKASVLDVILTTPKFFTNINSIIRQSDLTLLVLVQMPNHIEAAIIYWDMMVMISRTRKVCDALSEDLHYCVTKAREYRLINRRHRSHIENKNNSDIDLYSLVDHDSSDQFDFDNINYAEKKALNDTIELHLRLARVLNHEFLDLKRSHTLYLNLLFVGSGFCISLCISLIFIVKSKLMILILISLIISSSVPLLGVVLFCIIAEQTVSIFD